VDLYLLQGQGINVKGPHSSQAGDEAAQEETSRQGANQFPRAQPIKTSLKHTLISHLYIFIGFIQIFMQLRNACEQLIF